MSLERIYIILGFLEVRYCNSGLKYSDFMAGESVKGRKLCPMCFDSKKLFLSQSIEIIFNADSVTQ